MYGVHLWPMTLTHGISGILKWDIPGTGWGKRPPMDGDPSDWTDWFMMWNISRVLFMVTGPKFG